MCLYSLPLVRTRWSNTGARTFQGYPLFCRSQGGRPEGAKNEKERGRDHGFMSFVQMEGSAITYVLGLAKTSLTVSALEGLPD